MDNTFLGEHFNYRVPQQQSNAFTAKMIFRQLEIRCHAPPRPLDMDGNIDLRAACRL